MSLLTGRWGTDDAVTTRPAAEPRFFDNEQIAKHLEELEIQNGEWREFFAKNAIQPLFLSYEGIKDDLAGALRKIVTTFGLQLPSQEFHYVEPPVIEFECVGRAVKIGSPKAVQVDARAPECEGSIYWLRRLREWRKLIRRISDQTNHSEAIAHLTHVSASDQ